MNIDNILIIPNFSLRFARNGIKVNLWWIIKYFICHDKRRKSSKILQNANTSHCKSHRREKKTFLRLLFVWTKWLSSKYYPWPDNLFMKNCTHARYSISCLDINLRVAKEFLKHVTNWTNALLRFNFLYCFF